MRAITARDRLARRNDAAKEFDVDLIVMATHGYTGLKHFSASEPHRGVGMVPRLTRAWWYTMREPRILLIPDQRDGIRGGEAAKNPLPCPICDRKRRDKNINNRHVAAVAVVSRLRERLHQGDPLALPLRPLKYWQLEHRRKTNENPFCALLAQRCKTLAVCLQSHAEIYSTYWHEGLHRDSVRANGNRSSSPTRRQNDWVSSHRTSFAPFGHSVGSKTGGRRK